MTLCIARQLVPTLGQEFSDLAVGPTVGDFAALEYIIMVLEYSVPP